MPCPSHKLLWSTSTAEWILIQPSLENNRIIKYKTINSHWTTSPLASIYDISSWSKISMLVRSAIHLFSLRSFSLQNALHMSIYPLSVWSQIKHRVISHTVKWKTIGAIKNPSPLQKSIIRKNKHFHETIFRFQWIFQMFIEMFCWEFYLKIQFYSYRGPFNKYQVYGENVARKVWGNPSVLSRKDLKCNITLSQVTGRLS